MGKGGAQLGKAVKGKSKAQVDANAAAAAAEDALAKQSADTAQVQQDVEQSAEDAQVGDSEMET